MLAKDRAIYRAFADSGYVWHGRLALGLIWAFRVIALVAIVWAAALVLNVERYGI